MPPGLQGREYPTAGGKGPPTTPQGLSLQPVPRKAFRGTGPSVSEAGVRWKGSGGGGQASRRLRSHVWVGSSPPRQKGVFGSGAVVVASPRGAGGPSAPAPAGALQSSWRRAESRHGDRTQEPRARQHECHTSGRRPSI